MPYKDPETRKAYAKKYYSTYRSRDVAKWRKYAAEWKRQWRQAHPEEARKYQREYAAANLEKVRAQNRRSYTRQMANPVRKEKRLVIGRNWRAQNPDVVAAGWARWRQRNEGRLRTLWCIWAAKRRNAPGEMTESQWLARYAYYAGCCAYCQRDLTNIKCEMDHVIPIKQGGTNWASNFVPACRNCNRRKSSKRWIPRPVWTKTL